MLHVFLPLESDLAIMFVYREWLFVFCNMSSMSQASILETFLNFEVEGENYVIFTLWKDITEYSTFYFIVFYLSVVQSIHCF
jgi:hypothetical protein